MFATLPGWIDARLDRQIVDADLIVLTKTDLVDPEVERAARARLERLAGATPVLVGGGVHHGPGAVGRFLALGGRWPGGPAAAPDPSLFDAHRTTIVSAPSGATSAELTVWLHAMVRTSDERVVRVKGFVETADCGLVCVQVVGGRSEIEAVPEPERGEPTDLVVITLRS